MKPALFLSLIFFFITSLSAQDKEIQINGLDKVEEEIWSLEEDYISYFKEANHKAILFLYHSQFLGWPDSELHPAGKKRAAKFLEEKYPEPTHAVFNIKKEAIRVFEGVVITHYLLILSWIDDEGVDQTSEIRLTHTWIKEDSQWKILGGMSNRQ
jgi:ketosteroid isomerase-like protein